MPILIIKKPLSSEYGNTRRILQRLQAPQMLGFKDIALLRRVEGLFLALIRSVGSAGGAKC